MMTRVILGVLTALAFCLIGILPARAGDQYPYRTITEQSLSAQPVVVISKPFFLTKNIKARDYWPVFSPDGKSVLFSRSLDEGKTWKLFIIPTVGGVEHKFARETLPVSETRANWSSQNNIITFTGETRDEKGRVWIIQPDGTGAREIATQEVSDQLYYPSWYPSGREVAVMDANNFVTRRIDLQGHGNASVAVTDHAQVLAGMPSVSPDGSMVVFSGQKNTGQSYDQTKNVIWLVDQTGIARTVEHSPKQGRAPSWSPDGSQIAFESNRGSMKDLYAVFIINRDGTGLTRLTDYVLDANHPVWSPDGRQLVISGVYTNNKNATGIALIDVPKK